MKNHRSKGRARSVVVPRHGRAVRLSGGEKRRLKHQLRAGEGAGWTAKHAKRVLKYGYGSAAPLPRAAREKQLVRAKRAKARGTPHGLLGRAIRRLLGITT